MIVKSAKMCPRIFSSPWKNSWGPFLGQGKDISSFDRNMRQNVPQEFFQPLEKFLGTILLHFKLGAILVHFPFKHSKNHCFDSKISPRNFSRGWKNSWGPFLGQNNDFWIFDRKKPQNVPQEFFQGLEKIQGTIFCARTKFFGILIVRCTKMCPRIFSSPWKNSWGPFCCNSSWGQFWRILHSNIPKSSF